MQKSRNGNKKNYITGLKSRGKQTGILFVGLILISLSIGIATINLREYNNNQNQFYDDIGLITNSNGKTWESTGYNIQKAIDDLGASGGTVRLPVGTFNISTPIEIDNYITLCGVGELTRLRASADMTGIIINKNYGTENCLYFVIRDLSLDGNGYTLNGISIHTLNLSEGRIYSHALISHVHIHSCDGHAIFFDDAGTSAFENNYLGSFLGGVGVDYNNGDGLHIENSNDCTIVGNHILENRGNGIYTEAGHTGVVTGNYIAHNIGHGISCVDEGNYEITGNIVTQNGMDGIRLSNFHLTTISGNQLSGNGNHGIKITDVSRYNSIVGNNIYNSNIGVEINNSETNSVQSNFFRDNDIGVHLYFTSHILVDGNEFYSQQDDSIYVPNGGTPYELKISNNLIIDGTNGIRILDGSDVCISDNRIEGCTTPIDISNANVVRPLIIGNNWEGCSNDCNSANATNPRVTSNIDKNGAWWTIGDNPN